MAFGPSRQMRWLSAAAILFALTTAAAFLQPPKHDPYQSFRPQQPGWWLYPLEENAFQRLPRLGGEIVGLANPAGTQQLWAVGWGGLVLRSGDAGRTWEHSSLSTRGQRIDPHTRFNDVFFFDSQHGWIVGSAGTLLLTTDGGNTWQRPKSFPGDSFNKLSDVHFTSLAEGWAVGDDLFQTHDGGLNWQYREIGKKGIWIKIHFTDQTHAWLAGDEIATTTDGGTSWTLRTFPFSGTEGTVDIFALDAHSAWVVGDEGSVYVTEDEGQSWTLRARLRETVTPYRIYFLNREHGWVLDVAHPGPLETKDGGRTWARKRTLPHDSYLAIHFADQQRGWLSGNNILRTNDGGLTWEGSLQSLHSPTAITWLSDQLAFFVDSAGNIFRTRNSGKSWKAIKTFPAVFTDLHFVDAKTGWAVGLQGIILRTTNGGDSWALQPSDTESDFRNVHFTDELHGWVIASDHLFRTRDGGIHWQKIPLTRFVRQVWFFNIEEGWGWADDLPRSILLTTNGGRTWKTGASPFAESMMLGGGCQLLDSTKAFCWSDDELRFTPNRGAAWKGRTYPVPPGQLRDLQFLPDAQRGWAIDRASRSYSTTDSGVTWTRLTDVPGIITEIRFASATTGSALGVNGSIFVTHDGGKTWVNSRRHRIYPAPWYYLSLLLVLGFTWIGLRRRPPLAEQLSIADVLTSDRPVDGSQRDALNLDPLAQALSRFLRNESTQPPLTIAVTGEWGTGKSSLMNLLRDDLRRHGFHPVSFNAWHHQKEEHLLAALLENIRRQAIPAPWSRGGIGFRLRLLWIRGKRYWFLAFLVLFAIAVYTGLFLADPSLLSSHLADVERVAGRLAPWFVEDEKDVGAVPIGPGITWLLGLGAVAETLRRGLRSFGIRPVQLLASASGSLKLSALEEQLGFREQFSREFGDVTRALQPRSMVILIDDLDRCRPENVSEILEAVNFLVSSGECVIVMGLDIDRVERAIGLAFRDVATEMLDRSSTPHAGHIVIPGDSLDERGTGAGAPGGNSEDEELKLRRQRFARQYLEKLINIEVPVPRSNAEEFAKLFDVLNKEGWKPTPVAAFILKAAGIAGRWSLALLVVALLGAGFWMGFSARRPSQAGQGQATAAPAPGPAQTPVISSLPGKLSTVEPSPSPEIQGRSRLYPAKPGRRSPAFRALPLGLMALLLIWRAIQAQEDIVRDSPQFVGALRTWTPFLFSKRNNPRSAKRFLNRVRYYAMFQRPYIPPVSPLQKLLIRLKLLRAKDALKPAVAIPEDVLVALSAIQHCEREWLSDGNLYTDFGGYLRQEGVPESLLEHLEEFQRWGPLERYRESFARISTGIRVT